MGKKDLREERIAWLAESYDREAALLEKIVQHMKHEMELLRVGDYSSLRDSLAGRGGHVDDIVQLESRRREVEAELSNDGHEAGRATALQEAWADRRVAEARRRAAVLHRHAVELDSQLRDMARAKKLEMEAGLAGLAHGRAASNAYSGHGRAKPIPRFLDKER